MGNASSPFDSKGRSKIKCLECGLYFHRLAVHVSSHGLTIKQYQKRYPGAPTISETASKCASDGQRRRRSKSDGSKDAVALVEKNQAKPNELCFGVAKLNIRQDVPKEDWNYIPKHDDGWKIGDKEVEALEALAVGISSNDNILIVGPPGVGKTTLVSELAAIVNQPVRRITMDGDARRADFIGTKEVVVDSSTGQAVTEWRDGLLPDAAERGHWLLIDEFDSMPAHIGFLFHGVLEKNRHLSIAGDRGRYVNFDKNFRVIATANTLGYGDDVGMYAGTNVLNEALLDRFGVVIRTNYPTPKEEAEILFKRVPLLQKDVAKMMVDVASKIREANKNGACYVSFSTRRLIDWAEKTVVFDNPRKAAKVSVTNKLRDEDAAYVDGVIQRYFGGDV